MFMILAQATGAASAVTVFYLTLLFIFLTAIVTTVATKWARDKCMKLFHTGRITLQRSRGQMLWGRLKVFSSGIEVSYDNAYIDPRGRRKTSHLFYQADVDTQLLAVYRYHGHLPPDEQKRRLKQIERTFNPRFFRRSWRRVRNLANTLRDAFNAAIGAVVTQYQRTNPANAVLTTQAGAVTSMGQTLLGRFANAYEPLLEQYIGQPVILEMADPLNPNNVIHEHTGYLADYTQQYIALFNREHPAAEQFGITLPDVESGAPLPVMPPPPPPGGPAPALPEPLLVECGLAVRIDGARLRILNTRREIVAIHQLVRAGFDPLPIKMILPPSSTLTLPARDAAGGRLECEVLRCLDIVAPRRLATVRHAGELLARSWTEQFHLDRLPLVSTLLGSSENDDEPQQ